MVISSFSIRFWYDFPPNFILWKKNAAKFLLYEENKSWRKKKEEKMKEASVCSSLWSHGNYAKLPLLAAVTNHRVKAEDTKLITFNCCSIPPQFFLWYLPKKKRSKCVILIRRHSGISSHYYYVLLLLWYSLRQKRNLENILCTNF